MKVTLKDIAKLAGVSVPTASRILSGKTSGRRSSKRDKVFKVAEELGYLRSISHKKSAAKKIKKIGLILPRIGDPFFGKIGQVISQLLLQQFDYQMVLYTTENRLSLEKKAVELLMDQDVKGIIAAPDGKKPEHLEEIIKFGIPLVLFDIQIDGLDSDSIVVDNEYGTYTAIKYLIDNGHQRIGIIINLEYLYTMGDRLRGYRRALEEAGFPIDESLIIKKHDRTDRGYIETKYLLSLKNKPTAIFTANNLVTLGALEAIHEEKLRIPEDISLIGFDDFVLAPHLNPPLTVVSQPEENIGRMVVRTLIERINNPSLAKKKIVLKTNLIIRNSAKNLLI